MFTHVFNAKQWEFQLSSVQAMNNVNQTVVIATARQPFSRNPRKNVGLFKENAIYKQRSEQSAGSDPPRYCRRDRPSWLDQSTKTLSTFTRIKYVQLLSQCLERYNIAMFSTLVEGDEIRVGCIFQDICWLNHVTLGCAVKQHYLRILAGIISSKSIASHVAARCHSNTASLVYKAATLASISYKGFTVYEQILAELSQGCRLLGTGPILKFLVTRVYMSTDATKIEMISVLGTLYVCRTGTFQSDLVAAILAACILC